MNRLMHTTCKGDWNMVYRMSVSSIIRVYSRDANQLITILLFFRSSSTAEAYHWPFHAPWRRNRARISFNTIKFHNVECVGFLLLFIPPILPLTCSEVLTYKMQIKLKLCKGKSLFSLKYSYARFSKLGPGLENRSNGNWNGCKENWFHISTLRMY